MRPVLIGFLVSLLLHGAILAGVLHYRRAWEPATGGSPLAMDLAMFATSSVEDSADPEAKGEVSSATVPASEPELELLSLSRNRIRNRQLSPN